MAFIRKGFMQKFILILTILITLSACATGGSIVETPVANTEATYPENEPNTSVNQEYSDDLHQNNSINIDTTDNTGTDANKDAATTPVFLLKNRALIRYTLKTINQSANTADTLTKRIN